MDIGESGTGPRSRSSSVSRVCFIRCKKFKGNFTMALCSFGGVSDQCGATAWAPHETGMVPLLSCENDMTEWLKQKYKGSGAFGTRGRPGHTKRTGDSKYLLYTSYTRTNGFYRDPVDSFLLKRDHDILRYCRLKLFSYD